MEKNHREFLRALYSASTSNGGALLKHDEVNALGDDLQIPRSDILNLVDSFQRDGLVTVFFSGGLMLTKKGKDLATEEAGSKAPGAVSFGNIGNGSHVVFGSPGAVVGQDAMGHHASKVQAPLSEATLIGDLAAALNALRAVRPTLDETAKEPEQELESEVKATLQLVQSPTPDKTRLEDRLGRISGLLERLTNVTEGAKKLKPALKAVGTAIAAVAKWQGILLPIGIRTLLPIG